uniref:Uncharacterized protein n=1 Tax=Aegilops tauschii TaxID=37682 RepID=M8BYI9_AEGTA
MSSSSRPMWREERPVDNLAAARDEADMEPGSSEKVQPTDSKDIWMIIWVRGKYTAMMMKFQFMMMMMMDAFGFVKY